MGEWGRVIERFSENPSVVNPEQAGIQCHFAETLDAWSGQEYGLQVVTYAHDRTSISPFRLFSPPFPLLGLFFVRSYSFFLHVAFLSAASARTARSGDGYTGMPSFTRENMASCV